jgi:hypothetical protein
MTVGELGIAFIQVPLALDFGNFSGQEKFYCAAISVALTKNHPIPAPVNVS